MPLEVKIIRVQHRDVADQQLGPRHVERETVVCVGQVGTGWEQDGDALAGPVRRRADEERDVLLAAVALEAGGVDTAPQRFGNGQLKRGRPLEVCQIVLVEVSEWSRHPECSRPTAPRACR